MKTSYVKCSGTSGEHAVEILMPALFFSCSSSQKLTVSSRVYAIRSTVHHIFQSHLQSWDPAALVMSNTSKYLLPPCWSRFRGGSGAQPPVGTDSLALGCAEEESTDGVKGWGGVRMLRLGCCAGERTAASLHLPVLCGCSHNSVQSSDLNYTPTPRAVWYNRLCGGGLEDWVYREFRARFF